jgi:ribosome-binding factor A
VRSAVAREVRLRAMPEIRFVADDSIERTERVFKLLEQVGGKKGMHVDRVVGWKGLGCLVGT